MENEMNYQKELDFILFHMRYAANTFLKCVPLLSEEKGRFDIVTETDFNIENYLIMQIKQAFPSDFILSEEFNPLVGLKARTWTIDPIDGTFNFANSSPLFGIQCALIENQKIVMAAIILPKLDEEYYAIAGQGTYLNNNRIYVNKTMIPQKALISVGDYQHRLLEQAKYQHRMIGHLYEHIARVRMYGAACIDFSYVASAKTGGTIILTKNLWDIAPGLLIAEEAGAVITNIHGKNYTFNDVGVVVSANFELSNVIVNAFKRAEIN